MPSGNAAFASADQGTLMLEQVTQASLLDIRGVCRSFPKGSGEDLLVLEKVDLTIRSGESLTGLDFRLTTAAAVEIRGRVSGLPPFTVPEGAARIRFQVSQSHSEADLEGAADLIAATFKKHGAKGLADVIGHCAKVFDQRFQLYLDLLVTCYI